MNYDSAFSRLAAAVLLAGACTLGLRATTLTYADFSSVAGLQLNGDAAQVGNVLRLTPTTANQSGSAFSLSPVALGSDIAFSTYFRFRISEPGGIIDADGQGADGIVFALQTVSNTAGGLGGGIGYSGLSPSVGVEFDTWNNGSGDLNNGNHIGINLNGDMASVALAPYPTRMNDGDVWHAWVDYNGLSNELEVRLGTSAARPVVPFLSHTVDLASEIAASAFVGFTSGTGSAFGNHDILSWEFRNTFDPVDPTRRPSGVPDGGGSLVLLGLALAGLGWVRGR
jgi:hypothetical protein